MLLEGKSHDTPLNIFRANRMKILTTLSHKTRLDASKHTKSRALGSLSFYVVPDPTFQIDVGLGPIAFGPFCPDPVLSVTIRSFLF